MSTNGEGSTTSVELNHSVGSAKVPQPAKVAADNRENNRRIV
jgi:hypothetical protein